MVVLALPVTFHQKKPQTFHMVLALLQTLQSITNTQSEIMTVTGSLLDLLFNVLNNNRAHASILQPLNF